MIEFVSQRAVSDWLQDHVAKSKVVLKPLTGGLLNQNLLADVGDSRVVVKVYDVMMDTVKVKELHRMLAHAVKDGIPVAQPILEGKIDRHVVAVYPFINGKHPPRYRNTQSRIRTMGAMLGKIDTSLESFHSKVEQTDRAKLLLRINPERFLSEIKDVRASLRGKPSSLQRIVRENLDRLQRIAETHDWLEQGMDKLPLRMCHGDYHIKNVLMRGEEITAVLDWDKAGKDWRGFEIMRSVMFNCRRDDSHLSWPLVETYLKSYKRHAPALSELEKVLVFECGFRRALFSLWSVKQYIAGEQSVVSNFIRRVHLFQSLAEHRAEYAERIAKLL